MPTSGALCCYAHVLPASTSIFCRVLLAVIHVGPTLSRFSLPRVLLRSTSVAAGCCSSRYLAASPRCASWAACSCHAAASCRRSSRLRRSLSRPLTHPPPNNALQRTEAGGRGFSDFHVLTSPASVAELESVRRSSSLLCVGRHVCSRSLRGRGSPSGSSPASFTLSRRQRPSFPRRWEACSSGASTPSSTRLTRRSSERRGGVRLLACFSPRRR